jgi:hypothetical protein
MIFKLSLILKFTHYTESKKITKYKKIVYYKSFLYILTYFILLMMQKKYFGFFLWEP